MTNDTTFPNDSIDYGSMMHSAMRGLVRSVLESVAQKGLPGEHHFFICFDTTHPDVVVPPWLMLAHPDEMTVVLQKYFETFYVDDDGIAVTLNFDDRDDAIRIPFTAIKTFVDPSAEFGLRFEAKSAAA